MSGFVGIPENINMYYFFEEISHFLFFKKSQSFLPVSRLKREREKEGSCSVARTCKKSSIVLPVSQLKSTYICVCVQRRGPVCMRKGSTHSCSVARFSRAKSGVHLELRSDKFVTFSKNPDNEGTCFPFRVF